MNDSKTMVYNEGLNDQEKAKREIYLRTIYKDSKELYKQIFTLITGVIVLYSTLGKNDDFVEKLIVVVPLIFSLLLSVIGFYILKLAGEKATNLEVWKYFLKKFTNMDYKKIR